MNCSKFGVAKNSKVGIIEGTIINQYHYLRYYYGFNATNYRLDFLIFFSHFSFATSYSFFSSSCASLNLRRSETARFFHSFPKILAMSVTLASGKRSCICERRSFANSGCSRRSLRPAQAYLRTLLSPNRTFLSPALKKFHPFTSPNCSLFA